MKITIVSTGGTIVSVNGDNGLAPGGESSSRLIDFMSSSFSGHVFSHLPVMNLDSSNIEPEDWSETARAVFGALEDSDGVIVTHGTDTMAYTASALSFMLRGLEKPVTLTGSQIPFGYPGSDAMSNLQTAVAVIENRITGVTVSFGRKVIRGTRAVKTRTAGADAFESVGVPPLAVLTSAGLDIASGFVKAPQLPPVLENSVEPGVFLLKLTPGTNTYIFNALTALGYKGAVIEVFGAGGVHSLRRNLAAAIQAAAARGMILVTRSQCLFGKIDLDLYETGTAIRDSVISAGDMTAESAVVKLMWTLTKTKNRDEIAAMFRTNYAGEISL